MNRWFSKMFVKSGLLLAVASVPAPALTIRGYDSVRHDRFTGFSAAPEWNDGAWFDSRKFTAVGWNASDGVNKRQFALVTPRHILGASHARPSVGQVIRFLAPDGVVIERTVLGTQYVPNSVGGSSDVAVSLLSAAIPPESGVVPLPYLNLGSEAAYLNTELWVFGWHARVGRAAISGFSTLNEGIIADTRMMEFRYLKASGGVDDAYAVGGDSGSPSLALAGGRPAVVGVHSAVANELVSWVNFDAFIPHYVSGIDPLIEGEGYAMTPVYPEAVALEWVVRSEPAVPRRRMPGQWVLALGNHGPVTTGNVRVVLEFSAGGVPHGIHAPGWIVESPDAGTRVLRRASLAVEQAVEITAGWASLPDGPLALRVGYESDGCPRQVREFELLPVPSFREWAEGLADPEPEADPDGDGASNLIEYALGGDPTTASRASLAGGPLEPSLELRNGRARLRYLIREDAETRGLSYLLEFSDDLTAGSWSTDPPPGFETSDPAGDPPVEGFRRREVSFDVAPGRWFCRLHIALDEASVPSPAGPAPN